MTQFPRQSGPNLTILVFTIAAIAIGWNIAIAHRDAQGMKCYAQPVSAECPAQ